MFENKISIIPETEEQQSLASVSDSILKKASLAQEYMGATYDEVYENYKSFNSVEAIRQDLSHIDDLNQRAIEAREIESQMEQLNTQQLAQRMQEAATREHNRAVLEDYYAEQMASQSDEEWAKIESENYSIYQREKERNVRLAKILSIRDEYATKEENEGWWEESKDFVKAITLLPNWLDNFNFNEGSLSDNVENFNKLFTMVMELPEEQQPAAIRAFKNRLEDASWLLDNPQDVVDTVDRMLMTPDQLKSDEALLGAEIVFAVGGLKTIWEAGKYVKNLKGAKISEDVPTTRGTTGDISPDTEIARAIAGDTAVAEDIATRSHKFTPEKEVVDNVSILQAPNSAYGTGLAGKVEKSIERNKRVLSKLVNELAAPERLATIAKNQIYDFEQNYIGRNVVRQSINENTGTVSLVIGNSKSGAFKSEASARQAAKRMKLEEIDEVSSVEFKRSPSGWYIHTVNKSSDMMASYNKLGWFKSRFGNTDDVVPGLIPIVRLAEDVGRGVTAEVNKIIKRDLAPYRGKKGDGIRQTIARMQSTKAPNGEIKWYTTNEFSDNYYAINQRLPEPEEIRAFTSYRQLNDFAYELKLKSVTEEVSARGDSVYKVKTADGQDLNVLGHQVNGDSLFSSKSNMESVVVYGDEIQYYARGKMPQSEVEKMGGYTIIDVNPRNREDMFYLGKSEAPAKYMAIPKNTKSRDFVDADLSKYLGGGRIVDDSPFYIKVGRVVEDSAGDSVRISDRTLFSASSANQAKEGAKKIDELTALMRSNRDDLSKVTNEMVARIGLDAVDLDTVKAADDFMKRHGLYDSGIRIQGIEKRSMVQMDDILGNRSGSVTFPSNNNRSQIFGQRTESGVKNILGTDSTKLDPFEATVSSLNTVTEYASTSAMRERSLAYFKKNFSQYLVTRNSNPYELLTADVADEFRKNTKLVNAIQAHQKFLTNMFNYKTPQELGFEAFVEKMFRWGFDTKDKFFGKGGLKSDNPEELQKMLEKREKIVEMWSDNPATALRHLTFHTTLGLLSPGSFIMQALNVANITAITPLAGAKAGRALPAVRMGLLTRDPKKLDLVAKLGYKISGFRSKQEFIDFVEDSWKTGVDTIGGDHVLINGINGAQLEHGAVTFGKKASTVFFDQGEVINRLTAKLAAHHEYIKQFPKRSLKDQHYREWTNNRMHVLTNGMSRADTQLALTGQTLGVMMQFWSYPMRLTNAMWPEMVKGVKLGGSGAFTNAEKFRLAMMNVALWGGGGVPLLGYLTDYVAKTQNMSNEEAKLLTNGLFDYAIYAQTDGKVNTNMSGRVGLHGFYEQIIDAMAGDKSFLEIISGAAGSRGTQLGGAAGVAMDIIQSGTTSNPDDITETGLRLLAGITASGSATYRIYMAKKYGMLFSRNGNQLAEISDDEAWLQFWGIPPQAYKEVGILYKAQEEKIELIKEHKENYLRALRRMDMAETPEEFFEAREAYRALAVFANDDGVMGEALSGAFKEQNGQAMLKRMSERWKDDDLVDKLKDQRIARLLKEQREQEEDK